MRRYRVMILSVRGQLTARIRHATGPALGCEHIVADTTAGMARTRALEQHRQQCDRQRLVGGKVG
jgi:hypothetical protein